MRGFQLAVLVENSSIKCRNELGFSPFFATQLELLDDSAALTPARVTTQSHGFFELAGCRASRGELSGKLRRALEGWARPTTGDWVAVSDDGDLATIHHVLDRRTTLQRRSASRDGRPQTIAANVDTFFVVTSANRDCNQRRLERYLTAVWDGGARPVIVLNKVDLVVDTTPLLSAIEAIALAVPVVGLSAQNGTGFEALERHLERGATFGFIGSSGVGKSTIINRILGQEVAATSETRSDDKGRHTTTRRELIVLPGCGVLIDTPGMRELGIVQDDGGLDTTFAEIADISQGCRFRDCLHEAEPGCAVRAAVESGELAKERLESYLSLRREVMASEARRDPVLASNSKRRWKSIKKEMRAFEKSQKLKRR